MSRCAKLIREPRGVEGVFSDMKPSRLQHSPKPNWINLTKDNKWTDNAEFYGFVKSEWGLGKYEWPIEVEWRVGSSGSPNVLPASRRQIHTMLDSSGSSKISKSFGSTPALETTRKLPLLPIDIEEVISDQIAGNDANKLPTAYFKDEQNNPMLMATRSGQKAKLRVKMASASDPKIYVGARKNGTQAILGYASATAITELSLAADFTEHGYAGAIVTDLIAEAKDVRDAEGDQGSALSGQAGATAALPGLLKQGRNLVKCLDTVIKNRFRNDAEILGAWKTASHITASGGGSEEPPAPTPPPSPPQG